jgi:hypothetical protein
MALSIYSQPAEAKYTPIPFAELAQAATARQQMYEQGLQAQEELETELGEVSFKLDEVVVSVEERKLTFKGGFEIVQAIKQLYKAEFENHFPIPLEAVALPQPLLVGSSLNDVQLRTMVITTAFLNGIGNVTIEHDPSFDYDFGDFVSRGFVGVGGRSKRTWSMAIWDAASSEYSNALDKDMLPKGASLDPNSLGGNIYLVKPEGLPDINTSRRIGRTEGTNVNAVLDYMGEEFAVWGAMSGWIKDLGRVVLVEKADSADYSL